MREITKTINISEPQWQRIIDLKNKKLKVRAVREVVEVLLNNYEKVK